MRTEIQRIRVGMTNAYLLRERGVVIVDPAGPPGGRLGSRLVLHRLSRPPRLDLIVLTHAHFDHVAAAPALRDATRAPIAVHHADAPWLVEGRLVWPPGVTRWGRIVRGALGPVVQRFAFFRAMAPDVLIDDQGLDLEPYGVTGRVIHTPGHSPGSVSIVLPSGDAIVGDLAMNGLPFCCRPSFGIFADHPAQVLASWKMLIELGVHTVHPAHGRAFDAAAIGIPR